MYDDGNSFFIAIIYLHIVKLYNINNMYITELQESESAINWSVEITERFGSRLYALWNRTCGNCLLDSVLQATWGVFDRDNILRRAVADSLAEAMTL